MSDLKTDFESRLHALEVEWQNVHELSSVARADYQMLISDECANPESVCRARERLGEVETQRTAVLDKIKRLEARSRDQQRARR